MPFYNTTNTNSLDCMEIVNIPGSFATILVVTTFFIHKKIPIKI